MNIVTGIVLVLIALAIVAWIIFPSLAVTITISGILAIVLIAVLVRNCCKRCG